MLGTILPVVVLMVSLLVGFSYYISKKIITNYSKNLLNLNSFIEMADAQAFLVNTVDGSILAHRDSQLIFFEDTGVWDTGRAKELMQILLKTGVPVDCVLCNNDSMALGVVEACKEAGIDLSAVPVLGVDATAEGCAAIEAGEMAFTVYQSGTGQGEAAIEYALRIANGQSVKDVEGITEDGLYVWVPFVKVDSTNVSSYK